MAGNYPDAPSWRMAYDRDGTQAYIVDTNGGIAPVAQSDLVLLNDLDADAWSTGSNGLLRYLTFIFPEVRDLDGYAWWRNGGDAFNGGVQVSADTTNGYDGTWTTITSGTWSQVTGKAATRNGIVSTTALGIKAVRFGFNGGAIGTVSAVHLFGEPVAGQNPDRLILWHPTLDQRVDPAYFDWGNVPRGTTKEKTFRVKNNSPTKTAQTIRVAMETLGDATPSVIGWHQLSVDGVTFLAQVNVPDLPPGSISGEVILRRVTPDTAALGLWEFRVFSEASSWV